MSTCPICESTHQTLCFKTSLPDKENTDLILPYYSSYRLYHCESCDHYYVNLSEHDRKKLEDYYSNRTSEFLDENGRFLSYLRGDYPGSENEESLGRYQFIYSNFFKDLDKEACVLDFGCSQGEFLHFLHRKGFRNLIGVDIDKCALEIAQRKYGEIIQFLDCLQFKKRDELLFDVIVLDQVLEHVVNPVELVKWLNSYLNSDGFFVVSVPDINRYFDYEYITCQGFTLLEHVHHYSYLSFAVLFGNDKVNIYNHNTKVQPNFVLPLMSAKLTCLKGNKISRKNYSKTKICERLSFAEDKAKQFLEKIHRKISLENKPIILWGVSRELFFIFFPLLNKIYKVFVIDRNPKKQGKMIAGFKILPPDALFQTSPELVRDSILLITAVGYESEIYKEALQIGFSEDRIVRPSEIWKEMA